MEIENNEILPDFTKNYNIDISRFVEKKGKFDFLAWAYAIKLLRENYPNSSWRKSRHWKDETGYFVETYVKIDKSSEKIYEVYPVMENKKGAGMVAMTTPLSTDINTAYQRCLTKNIAMVTGIGLSLYVNEEIDTDIVEMLETDKVTDFFLRIIPIIMGRIEAGTYDKLNLPILIQKVLRKEINYDTVKDIK